MMVPFSMHSQPLDLEKTLKELEENLANSELCGWKGVFNFFERQVGPQKAYTDISCQRGVSFPDRKFTPNMHYVEGSWNKYPGLEEEYPDVLKVRLGFLHDQGEIVNYTPPNLELVSGRSIATKFGHPDLEIALNFVASTTSSGLWFLYIKTVEPQKFRPVLEAVYSFEGIVDKYIASIRQKKDAEDLIVIESNDKTQPTG